MDMLVSGDIDIEDYKLIDQEISRVAQDLVGKESLAELVEAAISKKKKLDSDQFFDIVSDIQSLSDDMKKIVEFASK